MIAAIPCLLAVAVLSATGCRASGTGAPETDRWTSAATETPQPERWPDAGYIESLAPARELVRAYLRAAVAGDRQAMTDLYLPETRRSAESVIARDLELARKGGPYATGPTNTTSVFIFESGLFPPDTGFTIEAEDVDRLRDLVKAHDDASIVMTRFSDRSLRPFFVVRDGEARYLVP